MSNFAAAFTGFKNVIGMFSGGSSMGQAPRALPEIPSGILYGRYAARVVLLFLVLFIFIWWPADNYTPEGFDTWSQRMSDLPDNVWYILLGVILSWGAAEFAGKRADASMYTSYNSFATGHDSMMGEGGDVDFLSMDAPPLDGRFANLNEDDPILDAPMEPNEVIEEWRTGATG